MRLIGSQAVEKKMDRVRGFKGEKDDSFIGQEEQRFDKDKFDHPERQMSLSDVKSYLWC